MLVISPLAFSESEIRNFSEKYIMSLESEYLFWYGYMNRMTQNERENYVKNRIFSESDLLDVYQNPTVLDVGAGGSYNVGTIPPNGGHTIKLYTCDVLAGAYDVLKQLYGLKPYVKIDFAFVERLTDRYKENSFDIVRMSNALDHCYDPFTGIFEMLKVAKIGGTVRLIHLENESEHEKQSGMHQWNITSEGEDSMLIWRHGFKADIRNVLKGCARIKTKKCDASNGRCLIISDIVKTDNIETSAKTGMNLFDETMILFCLMKTSEKFSSAHKKAGNDDHFRKSMSTKLIEYYAKYVVPTGLTKCFPSWLKRNVKKLLTRNISY